MDIVSYDINVTRQIALVAESGCINPRYINLGDAPSDIAAASYFQLRQMHTTASGVIDGQVVQEMDGFLPSEWQMYGQHHRIESANENTGSDTASSDYGDGGKGDPSNATESNL